MTQQEKSERRKAAEIRYAMMRHLKGERTNQHGGWVTGAAIRDGLAWCGPRFDIDESQAMVLLTDLIDLGYASMEDNREELAQPYTLEYLTYKLTEKGVRFMARAEPADVMIHDGRPVK